MLLHLTEIRIRDPFVLPVAEEGAYYLYGTTDENVWTGPGVGFDCYRSVDLRNWQDPVPAFRAPQGFWGTTQFWAPEVHRWAGRYFMFATFAAADGSRGTQVLVSDRPDGPFEEWSDGPITPHDWQCLDGTLHVDDRGDPWVVFCHEWLQVGDGAIHAQRLSADLRRSLGTPILLFTAGDAPWTTPLSPGSPSLYVTDGPWLHRVGHELVMLWSSRTASGYAIGTARSASGAITGPWRHDATPLWDADGGHGMLFETFQGRTMLALHRPNGSPHERAEFHPLAIEAGQLRVEIEAIAE